MAGAKQARLPCKRLKDNAKRNMCRRRSFWMRRCGLSCAKGYGATRIDDVCEAAGLTKGSFFYHFNSKEELALEAAEYSSLLAEKVFSPGPI